MLSGLELALGLTALLAGATGTWSPCGFSMVETLGGRGHGRGTAVAACVTFAAGALVGGVVTFAGLSLVGGVLHDVGTGSGLAAAAVVAAAAALAEMAGVRIVPQIRRQVPESWRRVMPMPVAGGLYGILLGLGFTTFVLTLAVWALAGICVAVGDTDLGLVIGVAFAIGRALPVVLVAPAVGTRFADAALEAMAERPLILRGLRLADGAALALCALALGTGDAEAAATRVAEPGTDPSIAATDVAWQVPGGPGILLRRGAPQELPGTGPAVGGDYITWRNDDVVTVARRRDLRRVFRRTLTGIDKLSISNRWVAFRRNRPDGGLELGAVSVTRRRAAEVIAAHAPPGVDLGRPSIFGNSIVFHRAGADFSAIRRVDLTTGKGVTLLRSRTVQLLHPSMRSGGLAYVMVSRCRQELRLALTDGTKSQVLARYGPLAERDAGHDEGYTTQGNRASRCPNGAGTKPSPYMLWSTALSRTDAIFTRVRRGDGVTTLMRVPRPEQPK